jgi:hypothetical protein
VIVRFFLQKKGLQWFLKHEILLSTQIPSSIFQHKSAISHLIFHITNYIKKRIPTSAFSFHFLFDLKSMLLRLSRYSIFWIWIFLCHISEADKKKVKLNIEKSFQHSHSVTVSLLVQQKFSFLFRFQKDLFCQFGEMLFWIFSIWWKILYCFFLWSLTTKTDKNYIFNVFKVFDVLNFFKKSDKHKVTARITI